MKRVFEEAYGLSAIEYEKYRYVLHMLYCIDHMSYDMILQLMIQLCYSYGKGK